jgi:DNA (cytosine-5)-methyltransferase 1
MKQGDMTEPKIGIYSFFSGAGFLDLGFERTNGFDVLFVNEYHEPFMDVYRHSRKLLGIKEPAFGYSIEDINAFLVKKKSSGLSESITESKRAYDLLGFIGGPPCPDFSVGGKNMGVQGENGRLSATYIELIVRNRPDFFLFENVKGLYRTRKHRTFFEDIKKKLRSSGYSLTEKLINAIEYGAPQDRERIILLGFRMESIRKHGLESHKSPDLKSFDWQARTKYDSGRVFSLKWPSLDPFIEDGYRQLPDGLPKDLTVQHWFEKNDVGNHPNSGHYFQPRAGLSKFQSIQEGDDLKKSYKRLHRWRYSPTAAYGNNEVHLHPFKPRRISAAEALAIQSLPKGFVIPDHLSLSNMFKTIGNGVPYLAGKGIAETIISYIQKVKKETPLNEEALSK